MIRNIIFDIGQVLVSYDWRLYTEGLGFSKAMAERIGHAMFLSDGWNELDRGVLSTEEVADSFVRNDPDIEKEIREVFRGAGKAVQEREFAPVWVKELKDRGYRVYYLSNYSYHMYEGSEHILKKFLDLMDGGVFSCEAKMIKPEAGIYDKLLDDYGLKAEECVFMDDNPQNVEGARKRGIHGILFTDYDETKQKLEELLNTNL